MDETVLTSNLKKMPKKLVKELTNDMLALFPKATEGHDVPPTLIASWLKVYSAIKQTHPSGNVGLNIPTEGDHKRYYQFSIDTEEWMEGEEVRLKLFSEDDEKLSSTILTREILLTLHNFIATAIAHLPNE